MLQKYKKGDIKKVNCLKEKLLYLSNDKLISTNQPNLNRKKVSHNFLIG